MEAKFSIGDRVSFFHGRTGDRRVGIVEKIIPPVATCRMQYRVRAERKLPWERPEDAVFYCIEDYLQRDLLVLKYPG
jgi:hypothetical protein